MNGTMTNEEALLASTGVAAASDAPASRTESLRPLPQASVRVSLVSDSSRSVDSAPVIEAPLDDAPKIETPAGRPVPRVEKVKKASQFSHQRGMLYAGYDRHPVDVRIVLKIEYWIGFGLAWTVLQLCNVRLFLGTVVNGFCVQEDYNERIGKCLHCNWYHVSNGAAYCRGCSCPNWIGSKLSNKLRLANHICPKGLFKRARGWFGRIFGAARHSSITPTVENQ